MVADLIVYHPTITKLINFLDSTPKREKLFRLIQYLSRFLSYYIARSGYDINVAKLFKSLQNQFAFIRKSMRFLKPLNHIQDGSKAYDNKLLDPILRVSTIVRNLAYTGYLSVDSITWFKLLGLVDNKTLPGIPNYSNWFWFIGIASGLVNDLRKIQINYLKYHSILSASSQINETNTKLESSNEKLSLQEINNNLYQAKRKLVWDSLDFFIVLNNLKYLNYTDGEIGAAGTLTSLFGLVDLWKATKA